MTSVVAAHPLGARPEHLCGVTAQEAPQVAKLKSHDIFSEVNTEVGQIIVAEVNHQRISEYLAPD